VVVCPEERPGRVDRERAAFAESHPEIERDGHVARMEHATLRAERPRMQHRLRHQCRRHAQTACLRFHRNAVDRNTLGELERVEEELPDRRIIDVREEAEAGAADAGPIIVERRQQMLLGLRHGPVRPHHLDVIAEMLRLMIRWDDPRRGRFVFRLPLVEVDVHPRHGLDEIEPLSREPMTQIFGTIGWPLNPEIRNVPITEPAGDALDNRVGVARDVRPHHHVVGKVTDRCLEPQDTVLIVESAVRPPSEQAPMRDERFFDRNDALAINRIDAHRESLGQGNTPTEETVPIDVADPIRTISADDLKAKLDRDDGFRLVNALGDWEFKAKRIPGSEHFSSTDELVDAIRPDEDVVVYCSNPACRSSQKLYKELVDRGYKNVRRFEDGLLGWDDAGYPFEGDDA
jgi:rhodanese-related sulfurtransferase